MYLHKGDRELFHDIIVTVSEKENLSADIVEKDYYVTMILKSLAGRCDNVVFKGGTSLSKAFHVIERFSEDVDISFTEHLGEGKRKTLKYKVLKSISEELGLPISNWHRIESNKNYNHYDFVYESIIGADVALMPWVKVETALMAYSFPTENREISNVIYDCLKDSDSDIVEEYDLTPFFMQVQSVSRTLVDKMYAVCDYFLLNKAYRNSRHLYDIYKLYSHIEENNDFRKLVKKVGEQRAKMDSKIAPATQSGVDIWGTVKEICRCDFYKSDYEETTRKLTSDELDYKTAIKCYRELMGRYFK